MTNLDHLKGHKIPGTRLTYIERLSWRGERRIMVRFLCDCGKECICSFNSWIYATTKSCGCLKGELAKAQKKPVQKTVKARVEKKVVYPQPAFLLGSVW